MNNFGESFDEDKSDASDSSSADQQGSFKHKDHKDKESKMSFQAFINSISSQKKIKMKDVFELYQKELDRKDKMVIQFEKEIAAKNKKIAELQGKILALGEKVSSEETITRKAVRRFSRQEPDLMAAREEVIQTLCDKYGKAMADLQNVTADYKALQDAVLRSGQEQEANIITAQESITVAVSAKVRCAELEEENSDLISQLIELKTKYAVTIENESAKNNELLSQIDGYVDKLAHMEKKYLTALAYALPQGKGDGDNTVETETAASSQNGGSNYSSDGAYMNVDDIYSIEESSNQVVSPIFARNLTRAGLTLDTGMTTPSSAAPAASASSFSGGHPPKSPFASHIAETSGPQVNPLSSKNWLWK